MEVPSLKEGKPLTTQVVRGGITKEEKEERKKRAELMAKLYVLPIALEIAPAIDRIEGAPLDEAFEATPSLREIMLLSLCDIISVCSAAIDARKKNMLGTDRLRRLSQ